MNRISLFLLCLVVSLAGCERSSPALEDATAPAATATDPVAAKLPGPVAAEAGDTGLEILLQRGVEVPFRHQLGYDIKDVSKNGTPRRRILLEVLEPDFAQATDSFLSALREAGYTGSGSDAGASGKREETYVKEGHSTYYLLIQDAANGPKLDSAEATGSIHVMWNER